MVYKPVIHPVLKLIDPLSVIQSEVVPFGNQAEQFESLSKVVKRLGSWLNGLQATLTA